jgi:NAD(P)H-nitrite reductase large subunit
LTAAEVDTNSDSENQDVICYCEWLTRDEIVAAIPYVRTLKELRETTRACTTCFGCEGDLDDLVTAHRDLFGTAL